MATINGFRRPSRTLAPQHLYSISRASDLTISTSYTTSSSQVEDDHSTVTPRSSVAMSSASSFSQKSPIEHISDITTRRISIAELEAGRKTQSEQQLPSKRHGRWVRNLRYTFMTIYRRLFASVFTANIIALIVLASTKRLIGTGNIRISATAVSANLFVATAIRQEYIINIIFRLCWLVPLSAPLRLRRILAKCYEYGGVHSGAAVSGTLWFIFLAANVYRSFAIGQLKSMPIVILTSMLLSNFLLVITFAHPTLRVKYHDVFERTHRWAGWTSAAIFWVEIILLTWELHERPTGTHFARTLLSQPSFWLLLLSTAHSIHPWLRLRRWTFTHERLSSHAMKLTFSQPIPRFSGIAISTSPLTEWHPFATFPRTDGQPGASLVVSNAGDFTADLIARPRAQYWVKGLPRHGPMSMAQIFRSVVFVTTGSGIGPCLTFLADESRRQPVRILWSTKDPVAVFGSEMVDTVRRIDRDAVIWDTHKDGRPDLPAMAYKLYREAGAEAVFVLSNAKLTRRVKYAMEARGVPAYGPIFDS